MACRPFPRTADAASPTLNGNYGFTYGGFSTLGTGPHVSTKLYPFDAVGEFTFDGAGSASATFAASLNGTSSTDNPYTATYTVNPDCTGSLTSTDGGDNAAFVIVSGGAEVLATDLSQGTTANIDLKKQ